MAIVTQSPHDIIQYGRYEATISERVNASSNAAVSTTIPTTTSSTSATHADVLPEGAIITGVSIKGGTYGFGVVTSDIPLQVPVSGVGLQLGVRLFNPTGSAHTISSTISITYMIIPNAVIYTPTVREHIWI